MNQVVTNKQQALLSLAVLFIMIVLGYVILILPGIKLQNQYLSQIDVLKFEYSHHSQFMNHSDKLNEEVEQLRNSQPDGTGFLEDKSAALAAADLQSMINALVISNGGVVTSTQVLRAVESGTTFPSVSIQVNMKATAETLRGTLYQIQYGNTALVIDNFQIQSNGNRRSQDHGPSQMDIQLDITGFIFKSI